jgi:hypothetical protein
MSMSSNERDELRKRPNFKEFEDGDLKVLENCSWEEAAFTIWHDMVKNSDPKHAQHSQKWTGMITARLLKSLADDSAATVRLTNKLVCLTWILVVLTVVLVADIGIRLLSHPATQN